MNYDGLGYGGGDQDFSYGGAAGGGGGGQDFSHNFSGGGGWMNSGDGGAGDDSSKSRGGYRNQTLRPVTIKQLVDVPQSTGDMPIHIDGDEVKQVTFIGVVRNITSQSVNVTYSIEDGTSKIDVRMWLNNNTDAMDGDESQNQMLDPAIAKGKYVRVYGDLKFFNNTRHISAHKIRAVTDHNEISYHGLEAIYVHLKKTKGPAPGQKLAGGTAASGSMLINPYATSGGGYGGMSGGLGSGMDPARASVLEAIKKAPENTREGVNISVIQKSLAGRFQSNEISDAVEWLINEGHVFTTLDDNHLQATTQ
ncbi:ATP-dependent RNA helicase dbp10 [Coemansia sp. RSA 1365]|nr:ATP-dependent RNA helicase dbp10 [Coemansia sp. RSA 1365]